MRLIPKFDLGVSRVIQGSYRLNTSSALRPALRAWIISYVHYYDLGFRVCHGVR